MKSENQKTGFEALLNRLSELNQNQKRFILLMVCLWIPLQVVYGQEGKKNLYPSVGEQIEDHKFTDLVNFPKKEVSISDFKGKWLILDVWGYSCGGCLASFPKMNKIHEKFKDKVQLIMVGATKSWEKSDEKKIKKISKEIYARLALEHQLSFSVAFDSTFYMKYDVKGLPQILIVDPNGVIKAKTIFITEKQIEELLAGKDVAFERSFSANEPDPASSYREDLPLLTNGTTANGGNDTSFLFRSMLVPWTRGGGVPGYSIINLFANLNSGNERGILDVTAASIRHLYQLAYFGMTQWTLGDPRYFGSRADQPTIEGPDTSKFDLQAKYSYSLKVPRKKWSPDFIMKVMQSDLENYFGYKGYLQKIATPVYYLELTDSSKLQRAPKNMAAKAERQPGGPYAGLVFHNFYTKDIAMFLYMKSPVKYKVIDKTGVDYPIDLNFKADMLDLSSVEKELQNHGLKLVKTVIEMETIVLKKEPLLTKTK